MSGISELSNECKYYMGKELSNTLASALTSQTTEKVNLSRRQVDNAINLQCDVMSAKTTAAVQNASITRTFLDSVATNLQTVLDDVTQTQQGIMTLLNGVVSGANKRAAVDKIMDVMGMAPNPTKRDELEGTVIKTLRQGGVGGLLYAQLATGDILAHGATEKSLEPNIATAGTYFDKTITVGDEMRSFGQITDVDVSISASDVVMSFKVGDTFYSGSLGAAWAAGPLTLTGPGGADDTIALTLQGSAPTEDQAKADFLSILGGQGFAAGTSSADKTVTTGTPAGDLTYFTSSVDVSALKGLGKITDVTCSQKPGDTFSAFSAKDFSLKIGGVTYECGTNTPGIDIALEFDGPSGSKLTIKTATAFTGKKYGDVLAALQSLTTSIGGFAQELDVAQTNSLQGFSLNPSSNYGAGIFSFDYDGKNVTFQDEFGEIIQSYPLDTSVIADAVASTKTGTAEIRIGEIGTLQVGQSYKVEQGNFNVGPFSFKTTASQFDAIVTVSANDGTRNLEIPDLTDPTTLWGGVIELDPQKLQTERSYQLEVKGMVDHASRVLRDALQNAINMKATLENDERGQNATLQSIHDLQDTVSKANPVEVASNVFETTQQYMQMLKSMVIMGTVSSQERSTANRMADLALSSGG